MLTNELQKLHVLVAFNQSSIIGQFVSFIFFANFECDYAIINTI